MSHHITTIGFSAVEKTADWSTVVRPRPKAAALEFLSNNQTFREPTTGKVTRVPKLLPSVPTG